MSDLYGEAPKAKPVIEELVPSAEDKNIYREIEYALNIGDSLIYLTGELEDFASFDFISRCRTILANRDDGDDSPINVIINSPGGSMYEMFSIIDYMKSLSVPVNTICRGRAFSAAAMILVQGLLVLTQQLCYTKVQHLTLVKIQMYKHQQNTYHKWNLQQILCWITFQIKTQIGGRIIQELTCT